MQIIIISLRVIFMLSTIVYATDCCSSRILLLKEQASKRQRAEKQALLAPSQNPHSLPTGSTTTTTNSSTQQQRRDVMVNIAQEYNKRFSRRYHGVLKDGENNFVDFEEKKSSLLRNEDTDNVEAPKAHLMVEKTTNLLKNGSVETSRISFNKSHDNHHPSQDFIIDPVVREKHAGNPKYHTIDLYYKIMRDVLSYECLGNFLTDFCLNGGRCFRYPIANHSFYSCECADGYVGERCESKALINELHLPPTISVTGHGLPAQPKILMARLFFTFPALIVLTMIYILIAIVFVIQHPKKQKKIARHSLTDYM